MKACASSSPRLFPTPTEGSGFRLDVCNHAAFASRVGDASSNGMSRLAISGMALPAMPCRSPTIPTVESTAARICASRAGFGRQIGPNQGEKSRIGSCSISKESVMDAIQIELRECCSRLPSSWHLASDAISASISTRRAPRPSRGVSESRRQRGHRFMSASGQKRKSSKRAQRSEAVYRWCPVGGLSPAAQSEIEVAPAGTGATVCNRGIGNADVSARGAGGLGCRQAT